MIEDPYTLIPEPFAPRLNLDIQTVRSLVDNQFPRYGQTPIKPLQKPGWDNLTFRLGKDKLIRLPSALRYAAKVDREQEWLPVLKKHLPFQIPKPLHRGEPSEDYPYPWSIYEWIEGDTLESQKGLDLKQLARDLARFLKALWNINASTGPLAGPENFFRGCPPHVYQGEFHNCLEELGSILDQERVLQAFDQALTVPVQSTGVLVHGDLSLANLVFERGVLKAIIDFGGIGVGDPACDLCCGWTVLDSESLEIFRNELGLERGYWIRARSWALWKNLLNLRSFLNTNQVLLDSQMELHMHLLDDPYLETTVPAS